VLNNAKDTDALPAVYHYHESLGKKEQRRLVANPAKSVTGFLDTEPSLGDLEQMLEYLWFAGSKRPAAQLHFQVAIGREITFADRMDLHLLWDNNAKIFLKPMPWLLGDKMTHRGALDQSRSPAAATV
jgi:hypothetical protein